MTVSIRSIVLAAGVALAALVAFFAGQSAGREQSQLDKLADDVRALSARADGVERRLADLEDWRKRTHGQGGQGAAP